MFLFDIQYWLMSIVQCLGGYTDTKQNPSLSICCFHLQLQVFLVRKNSGKDSGSLYAMKVLKKASLKGKLYKIDSYWTHICDWLLLKFDHQLLKILLVYRPLCDCYFSLKFNSRLFSPKNNDYFFTVKMPSVCFWSIA